MSGGLGQLDQQWGRMSHTLKLALGSILVGLAVLTLKYFRWTTHFH